MQLRESVYLLICLILLAGLANLVQASTNSVSFSSAGVTMNATFPVEAHPSEVLSHNVTLTSLNPVTLKSVTIVITAQQDGNWQEIYNGTDTLSQPLPKSYNLEIALPQWVSGTLSCSILVRTVNAGDLSTTFYSTTVSQVTFSELQTLYNEILANYSELKSDNNVLSNQYNALLVNCSSLLTNYNALVTESDYLRSAYESLRSEYDLLNQTYSAETKGMQQKIIASENALVFYEIIIAVLAVAVALLAISAVYTWRKEHVPYTVINKETFAFRSLETI